MALATGTLRVFITEGGKGTETKEWLDGRGDLRYAQITVALRETPITQ